MISFKTYTFKQLTSENLYSLLKLRSEVFVVEQDCVYQDIDSKDQKALHVLGFFNNELVAYSRLFSKGIYFNEASIGRVVVANKYRNKDFGHLLMRFSIAEINKHFNEDIITISAQEYLQKFYEQHGFVKVSESYLEDNIPHIRMKKIN